jgi:beta-glucanase (GH16 family)
MFSFGVVSCTFTASNTSDTSSSQTVAVTGVTISGSSTVAAGKTITLTASPVPSTATNKTAAWSVSSGSDYASVNSSGVVTGKNAGTAVIKATIGGKYATKTVTVTAAGTATVAVTSVTVTGTSSVTVGSTITLTASVLPSNATDQTVTWSVSAGSAYASVSASGVVTGKAAGTATITATAGGVTSSGYSVTVTSSSSSLLSGATDGTSVTGTASTYTASDTTWDTLVWSDEFEGTSLKTADWSCETGAGGWGNSELETYAAANATVHEGVLDIEAKSDLTSARIVSRGLKTFKYGKIEARLRTTQGTGSWPAFWMLGTGASTWPYQGEIDIMEHANSDAFTYQTLHWNSSGMSTSTTYSHAQYGCQTNNNPYNNTASLDTTAWHTYSIEWTSTLITFYLDGTKVMAMDIGDSSKGTDAFNYPFYIIFNFAMGGQFPGVYDSASFTGVPWHMYVDYVRVYQ